MAITFTKERATQTSLLWVLLGVVALTAGVVWRGFFATAPSIALTEERITEPKSIDMRWEVLEEEFWSGRAAQEQKPPVSEPQGRSNPFLPLRP